GSASASEQVDRVHRERRCQHDHYRGDPQQCPPESVGANAAPEMPRSAKVSGTMQHAEARIPLITDPASVTPSVLIPRCPPYGSKVNPGLQSNVKGQGLPSSSERGLQQPGNPAPIASGAP